MVFHDRDGRRYERTYNDARFEVEKWMDDGSILDTTIKVSDGPIYSKGRKNFYDLTIELEPEELQVLLMALVYGEVTDIRVYDKDEDE